MKNHDRIINGIKAYSHEQKVLLRLIRKHGKLSETHFDEIFDNYPRWSRKVLDKKTGDMKNVPIRARLFNNGISGDSFMLGGLICEKDRNWWLDLLQHMMAIDLVNTSKKDGLIYYETP